MSAAVALKYPGVLISHTAINGTTKVQTDQWQPLSQYGGTVGQTGTMDAAGDGPRDSTPFRLVL